MTTEQPAPAAAKPTETITSPSQGAPIGQLPPRKKSHTRRNVSIAVAVVLIVIAIGALAVGAIPPTGTPNEIRYFVIQGNRTQGFNAFFFLSDSQEVNVVADGTVAITIYNNQNQSVYSSSFHLDSSDFHQYQSVLVGGGGTVWGYEWPISASQVGPSTADLLGYSWGLL